MSDLFRTVIFDGIEYVEAEVAHSMRKEFERLNKAIGDGLHQPPMASDLVDAAIHLAIKSDWQDSVRDAFIKAGVKPEDIDGAGSDGDEWAFTDAEIHQGINALVERAETAAAEVERLRAALEGVMTLYAKPGEDATERFERVAAEFDKETGFMRPGKSQPMECAHTDAERQEAWDKWVAGKIEAARKAVSP